MFCTIKSNIIALYLILAVCFMLVPEKLFCQTVDIRISNSTDDAEELGDASGAISLTSSKLDIGGVGGVAQYVGLRFPNINIPQGSNITSAYIQFTAQDVHAYDVDWIIYVENVGNAMTFSSNNNNISNRNMIGSINCTIQHWNNVDDAGPAQRTPDLTSLIQPVISRSDWSSGNALVIIILGNSGGMDHEAWSYDGAADKAPLLHIEYTSSSSTPVITPNPISLSFSAVKGSTNPQDKSVIINNSGTGTISWQASEYPDKTWMSLINITGVSGDAVVVSIDITGLNAGTYNGVIRIVDTNASNSPKDIPVTLVVSDPSSGNLWYTGSGDDIYRMNGKVGIGTISPGYTLDVNGTIRANEIIVNTSGADFVFDKNYQLKSIKDIEYFIILNKHLPGIPSAEDMGKNGLSIGDMNIKLLQKIEELTLYIIQQEKSIAKLREINKCILNKLNDLESKGVEQNGIIK